MSEFDNFFKRMTDYLPYSWQKSLASHDRCTNHLIRIPTGMGKTLGILSAWLFHRAEKKEATWPRRLVWCLPMRVLVEQTADEINKVLKKINREDIKVYLLMGGEEDEDWRLYPEREAILIGTQDMLISRALNRGYASARARWPMEYALLNQDALWVLDEVQLMDVGAATTSQIQSFRQEDESKSLRPCFSWWMSATIQPEWLKSIDTELMINSTQQTSIPQNDRKGGLWEQTEKSCELHELHELHELQNTIKKERQVAELALNSHKEKTMTLIVVNTVKKACQVFQETEKLIKKSESKPEIRLIHSRFRGEEKEKWKDDFINKNAIIPDDGRIIVATQVIEAGADISADLLITDLAPWSSLVQRFGRSARFGGKSKVIVIDTKPKDDKAAAPYKKDDLDSARWAIQKLNNNVSVGSLEQFEEQLDENKKA